MWLYCLKITSKNMTKGVLETKGPGIFKRV